MRLFLFAAAFSLCTTGAYAASFQNGDFEDGPATNSIVFVPRNSTEIAAWEPLKDGVYYFNDDYWQTGSGNNAIYLSDGVRQSGIWQKVDTIAGQHYYGSFLMAGDPTDAADKRVQVRVYEGAGGNPQGIIFKEYYDFKQAGHTAQNMGWTRVFFDFVATSSRTTIEFKSVTENSIKGAVIDGITFGTSPVTQVPLPFALTLFLSGLAGLKTLGRRRG
ncbi:MAG: DUF642 domain-containing protein [Alphaproteobacteria bacterium]|nr:DUF642 domain-containing protein [Alphaproteobacteria bacterium]